MVLAYAALAILFFLPSKFYLRSFNEGYLEKDNTWEIRGGFVLLVFFSHFVVYTDLNLPNDFLNNAYGYIRNALNQLVVTMFFFYSGYGIMKSVENKGDKYVKGFFLRRFLPLYIYFAFIVLIYLIRGLCLGNQYDWSKILLSFVGWENVGNEHWYMFVIFVLYIFLMVVFLMPKLSLMWKNVIFTLLSCGLVVLLYFTKGQLWYNTLLCFPLGMWYCLFKSKIDVAMRKHVVYWATLAVAVAVFITLRIVEHFTDNQIAFIVMSLVFSLVIVLFSMKVQSRNPILNFFGHHVFSIYMLQKIFLLLFVGTPLYDMYPLYFVTSLSLTVIAAFIFDLGYNWLQKKYFGILNRTHRGN